MKVANEDQFKREACELIGRWLGEHTAMMYRDFYRERTVEDVYVSLEELLIEMVGEQQTKLALEQLKEKYQIEE